MMKSYARIAVGVVEELIETDEDITTLYHPDLVWIDITDVAPYPAIDWTYVAGVFAAPVPLVRTPEQIRADNVAQRDYLLAVATLAIAPLQDAVDLDEATVADAAMLKTWKQFRVTVNRVDLSIDGVAWPSLPA